MKFVGRDGVRFDFALNPPAPHQQDSIGVSDELGDLIGNQDDPGAFSGEPAHDLVDAALGRDVDPDGRAVEDEDFRTGGQPLADDNALLVAAGKRLDGDLRIVDLDA